MLNVSDHKSSDSSSLKPRPLRGCISRLLWFVLGLVVATVYTSLFSRNALTSIGANARDGNDEEFERLRDELAHVRTENTRLRVSRDMAKKHLGECLQKKKR